ARTPGKRATSPGSSSWRCTPKRRSAPSPGTPGARPVDTPCPGAGGSVSGKPVSPTGASGSQTVPAYALPAFLFQVGRHGPPAAEPTGQMITALLHPGDLLPAILVQQLPVAFELGPGDGRPALAEGQGPDIGRPPFRPVPAEQLARVALQQHF